MALKKIVLHGPALDNLDNYHSAGSELEIGPDAKPGIISADRAQALIASAGAVSATEAAAVERAAKTDQIEA
jgi:hypothetical protein